MAMIGWLVVFVALVGIEVGTMALTTIWFAGGALAAFFMALAGLSFQVQMTVFLAVSFVLLIFTRPFAVKFPSFVIYSSISPRITFNPSMTIGKKILLPIYWFLYLYILFLVWFFSIHLPNKGTVRTNVDGLVGKKARVLEEIDNGSGSGTAVLNGQEWTARAVRDDLVIHKGETVIVKEIRGVKLMVDRISEGE